MRSAPRLSSQAPKMSSLRAPRGHDRERSVLWTRGLAHLEKMRAIDPFGGTHRLGSTRIVEKRRPHGLPASIRCCDACFLTESPACGDDRSDRGSFAIRSWHLHERTVERRPVAVHVGFRREKDVPSSGNRRAPRPEVGFSAPIHPLVWGGNGSNVDSALSGVTVSVRGHQIRRALLLSSP